MGIEKISYETEGRRYKSEGENYSGVLKLLEVLLSPEKEPEKKKKILEEDFEIEMTTEIQEEVLHMCNLSEGIEWKGIEKGIEEGIKLKSVEGVYNLMTQTSLSMERSFEILAVQEADREEIARLVNEKIQKEQLLYNS